MTAEALVRACLHRASVAPKEWFTTSQSEAL